MKYSIYFKLILFGFAIAFLAASCTKVGPQGLPGQNGTNGIDGTNGTDGTAVCSACHSNDQLIYSIEQQYAASGHATGTAFERNTGECATCHTSQGFIGKLNGTYDWTDPNAEIHNPAPQNCYTCHSIHKTYTTADLALTVSGPIAMRNISATHDFGKGDVCASCHQGRTVEPDIFPTNSIQDSITIGSRYGLHHGPQSNILAGVGMGLFEVGDGLSNHPHSSITDACVTCHMADAYGTQAGGHTWNMTYVSHGATDINSAGCYAAGCHDDNEDMNETVEGLQTEVKALLAELKVKLDASGITKSTSTSNNSGKFPELVCGAFLDYDAITQDGSFGVHNPKYVKKLLENVIDAMDALN